MIPWLLPSAPAILPEAILSDAEVKKLKDWKYQSGTYTPLDNLMNPLWTKFSEIFPDWMAPNAVTLSGFSLLVAACAFMLVATLLPLPPLFQRLSLLGFFTAQLLYQFFDAADGKVARRMNHSTCLGCLMDHGLDALALCLQVFATVCCFDFTLEKSGHPWPFMGVMGCFIAFFMAQWAESVTHKLEHQGVTEGQFLAMGIIITPFFWTERHIYHDAAFPQFASAVSAAIERLAPYLAPVLHTALHAIPRYLRAPIDRALHGISLIDEELVDHALKYALVPTTLLDCVSLTIVVYTAGLCVLTFIQTVWRASNMEQRGEAIWTIVPFWSYLVGCGFVMLEGTLRRQTMLFYFLVAATFARQALLFIVRNMAKVRVDPWRNQSVAGFLGIIGLKAFLSHTNAGFSIARWLERAFDSTLAPVLTPVLGPTLNIHSARSLLLKAPVHHNGDAFADMLGNVLMLVFTVQLWLRVLVVGYKTARKISVAMDTPLLTLPPEKIEAYRRKVREEKKQR